jgi:hypothetical protein
MIFKNGVLVELTAESSKDGKSSKHVKTEFNIYIDKNLDKPAYLDPTGLPTKDGAHTATVILVQGLIGNIHFSHEKGFRDSADHLRYIIQELERGFASVATVKEGEF